MSSDEEMAIIGRIMLERQEISRRNAVLHEEIYRIATGLKALVEKLTGGFSMYAAPTLSTEELALLDAQKLSELLSEK